MRARTRPALSACSYSTWETIPAATDSPLPNGAPLTVPWSSTVPGAAPAMQTAARAVLAKGTGTGRKTGEELDHAIRQIISKAVVSEEVIDVFDRHPCVRAYFNDHHHAGNFAERKGIPYVTFRSMLHQPDLEEVLAAAATAGRSSGLIPISASSASIATR